MGAIQLMGDVLGNVEAILADVLSIDHDEIQLLTKQNRALKGIADGMAQRVKDLMCAPLAPTPCKEDLSKSDFEVLSEFLENAGGGIATAQREEAFKTEAKSAAQKLKTTLKDKEKAQKELSKIAFDRVAFESTNFQITTLRTQNQQLVMEKEEMSAERKDLEDALDMARVAAARTTDATRAYLAKTIRTDVEGHFEKRFAKQNEEFELKFAKLGADMNLLLKEKATIFVGQLSFAIATRVAQLAGHADVLPLEVYEKMNDDEVKGILVQHSFTREIAELLHKYKGMRNPIAHPSPLPSKDIRERFEALLSADDKDITLCPLSKAIACLRSLNSACKLPEDSMMSRF